ncbi:MAG: hypothetical protein ACREM3_06740 [Candidatus Rokuibacteriota bacterium]
MRYAKSFFDLQLRFAQKVTDLSGLPFARSLLEYTNLYVRFGLGRDFDPAHPTWREYLAGLWDTSDSREWTYRFYLTRSEAMAAPPVVASFGCFSYALSSGGRIRLHFRNTETDGRSPLGVERLGQRLADLTALFGHVKRTLGEPLQVVGASWLYNLDAYRRLFPPSYLVTARVIGHRFQHMPLWGQFLDRHGEIRESVTRPFLERLERQSSLDDLDECFPLRVLSVEASVLEFYKFYGIQCPGHPTPPSAADPLRSAPRAAELVKRSEAAVNEGRLAMSTRRRGSFPTAPG